MAVTDRDTQPIVRALDHVYYWVADMDRAVAFYRHVVGLSLVRRDGDTWAEFDGGGARFALHRAVDGHPTAPGGATAAFSVDDLDEARALLADRGARFVHEAQIPGYGRYAVFTDPDGNNVQIIEYLRGDGAEPSDGMAT